MAGRAIIDRLREGDAERIAAFYARVSPDAAPPVLGPNQYWFIMRDEADPDKIVGVMHAAMRLEMRQMLMDKTYDNWSILTTIAFEALEALFRQLGFSEYIAEAPKADPRLQQFYRRTGTLIPVDDTTDTFRKRL